GGGAGAALVPAVHGLDASALTARGARQLAWAAGQPDELPHERIDVLIGATLQVLAASALRGLPVPAALSPRVGPQACPCCGSAAQAGVVLAAEGKAGLRYLECSLCGSRWHAVRARCTLCDDPHEVTYQGIEGHHPGVLAETCDGCHGYIKTMFRDKDPQVEPLADDLATLALDVLVGEAGHGRAAPHLFLLAGDLGG
ncbi:MAG: FdhE protein, partial [Pseudomonadota bacterium]|nr:FdhE protein [Pseudomonadota bacterium]